MDMMTQFPMSKPLPRNTERQDDNHRRQDDDLNNHAVSFPSILQETNQPTNTATSKSPNNEAPEKNISRQNGGHIHKESQSLVSNEIAVKSGAKVGILASKPSLLNMMEAPLPSNPQESVTTGISHALTLSALADSENNINENLAKNNISTGKLVQTSDSVNSEKINLGTIAKGAAQVEMELMTEETQTGKVVKASADAGNSSPVASSRNALNIAGSKSQTNHATQDLNGTGKENLVPEEKPQTDSLGKFSTTIVKDNLEVLKQDNSKGLKIAEAAADKHSELKPTAVVEVSGEDKELSAEVASLVKNVSEEIDQLSAKTNAQKMYQQPSVSTENGATAKATLADLDLDSGTTNSQQQKQDAVSKLLATTTSTTVSKSNIKGQVLSKVVKHLQDEMGREKLTIRLNPEKLGLVEIQFQAKGDNLNIIMNASNPEAEGVIKEGARELAENIADKSMRWNLVEVRVDSKGQDQQKSDARQNERKEKQEDESKHHHHGQQNKNEQQNSTGAGEWAAYHLGG